MTEQEKSETPASGGSDAAANSQAGTPPQFGTFGSARGSGLARGKRTSAATAATPAPNEGEYKPTALEVIIPRLEYKNPFDETASSAAPAAEAAPAKVEPAPAPVKAYAAPSPAAAPAPVAVPAPEREEPAPAARPVFQAPPRPAEPVEHFPFEGSAKAPAQPEPAKSELKILPPAESRRAPQHWDNASSEQRSGGQSGYPPRQPRDPRDEPRRERRPDHRSEAPRNRDDRYPPASSAPARKSGGFLAWLKGLFSPQKPATSAPPERERDSEFGHDREHSHGGHRRRRRGGRGRHRSEHGGEGGGYSRSSSGEPHQGGGEPHQGGHSDQDGRSHDGGRSGEHQGGQHRRRHRGGRNRRRDGQGPRPEGQQGGGFI